jgi:hypothetical protein
MNCKNGRDILANVGDGGHTSREFHSSLIPTVDQGLAIVSNVEQTTASWAILPDDGMNLGRVMRCWMMSYLC